MDAPGRQWPASVSASPRAARAHRSRTAEVKARRPPARARPGAAKGMSPIGASQRAAHAAGGANAGPVAGLSIGLENRPIGPLGPTVLAIEWECVAVQESRYRSRAGG